MLNLQCSPNMPRFAFGEYDEVLIDGVSYRATDCSVDGYVFVRTDARGVAESFPHAVLSQRVANGTLEHRRDEFLPENAKRRLRQPTRELSTLSPKAQRRAKYHEALVLAFLEMEKEGKVKRTEASTKAVLEEIKYRAGKYYSVPSDSDEGQVERNTRVSPNKVSASRLLKRVAAYCRDGLTALYGQDIQNNRARRIGPDELCLLSRTIRNYLSPEQPTIAFVVEDVHRAFLAENERRKALIEQERNGEVRGRKTSLLELPSRETIRREIGKLDPFEVVASREGLEKARKKFAPVGMGLTVTRPLQRVEMDAWKVDLKTIMATAGIWSMLDDKEKAAFGLEDGKKTRWFLIAAMCTTTRCILAMKLARAESGRAAVQTIDMIVRDKGVWADAVGTLTPWNMSGTPELIVTDAGSGFIDFDTRAGATDLGIAIDAGPAGMPEFRARIERMFGTMASSFIGRFTGRTFRNTVVKGDYDSDKRAALTSEELSEALVRWVVDVYHRRPHAGLGGETPLNCWNRLVEKFGVAPMPSLERRRKALGTRTKYTAQKDGITILGVRYHSKVFARWFMHARDREVRVRWYSEDIGAIAVELNGAFVEIPAVLTRFCGQRAQTWLMAVREIRAARAAEAKVSEQIIAQTMDHIVAMNANAMARQGLFVEDFSEERLKRLEDTQLIGFEVEDTPREPIAPSGDDGLGAELLTNQSRSGRQRAARSKAAATDATAIHGATDAVDVYGLTNSDVGWSIEDN